jgi:hypothetical protein
VARVVTTGFGVLMVVVASAYAVLETNITIIPLAMGFLS